MRVSGLLCFLILLPALPLCAQEAQRPSSSELKEISGRGRALADYDQAASHAGEAVKGLGAPSDKVELYVGRRDGNSWDFVFGKLDEQKAKLLIAYEAQGQNPRKLAVSKLDPPREDISFFFHAARAIATATADFLQKDRPYDTLLLQAAEGKFYVYLIPARTKPGIFPLGGDVRYLVSADGGSIVEKRVMHLGVMEFGNTPGSSRVMIAALHQHILSEVPEDTDVLHVLRQDPPMPLSIITKSFTYEVRQSGNIDFRGKALKF